MESLQPAGSNNFWLGRPYEQAHGSMKAIEQPGVTAETVVKVGQAKAKCFSSSERMPGHNGQNPTICDSVPISAGRV